MPLSAADLQHLETEGWVLAKGIIPAAYIHALQREIDGVIDATAQELAAEGKITDTHPEADFLTRAALVYQQSPEILAPVTGGTHAGEAMFKLLTCPPLLDAMEQLVGPEVVASSIYRLRPKLPFWEQGIVPVHQDAGYFDSCADESTVITAWVPLMDATHETGCMEVLPRVHNLGTLRHYNANVAGPGLAVHPDALPSALADTRMEDDSRATVPVPCGVGDALIMSHMTPHGSGENTSGLIRWAADLRYNAPEAGDYGPGEKGFLARSKENSEEGIITTDWRDYVRMRKEHVPTRQSFRRDWTSPSGKGWMKHDEESFLDDSLRIDRPGGPRTVGGEILPLDAYDGGRSEVVKGKAGVFSKQWFPLKAPAASSKL